MYRKIIELTNKTGENFLKKRHSYVFKNIYLKKGYYRLHIKIKSCKPSFSSSLKINYADESSSTYTTYQYTKKWTRNLIYLKNKSENVIFYPVDCEGNFTIHNFELLKISFFDLILIGMKRFFWDFTFNIKAIYSKFKFSSTFLIPRKKIMFNLIRSQKGCQFKKTDYYEWIQKFELDLTKEYDKMLQQINYFIYKPIISIIMPVYNTNPEYLIKAIDSVINQLYYHWELCICNDGSTDVKILQILDSYERDNKKIKIIHRTENGNISNASNDALGLVTGEYTALLDHDDELRPNSLYEIVKAINASPNALFIYSDEDKIDNLGNRFMPYFKPDWDKELFYSQNYLNHLTVLKTDRLKLLGGWRVGYEGAQDYDLYLRYLKGVDGKRIIHIPKVLYHWRAIPGSTALNHEEKQNAKIAGVAAVQDYLSSYSDEIIVTESKYCAHNRILWPLPKKVPFVSIIIPVKDFVGDLKKCIVSILQKTTYKAYEIIIVDNESREEETKLYLSSLSRNNPEIKIQKYASEFNFSAINNIAVQKYASGEIIALVNSDIEIISNNWLEEMISISIRSEVGAVGGKLYYPDNTIQHAGIILGIGGVAAHSHRDYSKDSFGYFNYLQIVRSVSAVTAALMVIEKKKYIEISGFDEDNLPIAFNDVDFCLRLMEKGYRNIFTPYAEAYHYESKTRGYDDTKEKSKRFQSEVKYMQKKWSEILYCDPYYSINLSDVREDYSLK